MAHGEFSGMTLEDAKLRALFQREAVLESSWYRERIRTKQARDIALFGRHVVALETFLAGAAGAECAGFDAPARLRMAREHLARATDPAYCEELLGTIGADPLSVPIAR